MIMKFETPAAATEGTAESAVKESVGKKSAEKKSAGKDSARKESAASTSLAIAEPRCGFWTQFGKAQLSSTAASAVDLSAMFILVEISGVFYAYAVALGAFAGAVTNFLLNRNWSFEAKDGAPTVQAWRYAQVSITGLGLNVAGTYALTEVGGFKYGFARITASLLVGFLFNFPLHRHYVFK